MDDIIQTIAEKPLSKTKDEVIKESKRIEEACLYSAKGHFSAAYVWRKFHLCIGIPVVVLSAIAGATALSRFDPQYFAAGIISLVITGLSAVMTFLNPNERAAAHLNAGNNYDSLMNKVRIFWSIDCWRDESEQVLTERVKYFSEQKDKLNQNCPQIPTWAYNIGKRGINAGEAEYRVDKQ